MSKDTNEFIIFANELADNARKVSLSNFKRKINIKNKNKLKNGFDPVTFADTKIQNELNRLILKSYPDHSISVPKF